jgi:hypothetical protein
MNVLGDTRDGDAAFLKVASVRLERLLPGPIERVWNHLLVGRGEAPTPLRP